MGATWEHEPRYPGGPADMLIPAGYEGKMGRPIWGERRCSDGRTIYPANLPRYSSDIAAAFDVVEKFAGFVQVTKGTSGGRNRYACEIWDAETEFRIGNGFGALPAEAICLAALAAANPTAEETKP